MAISVTQSAHTPMEAQQNNQTSNLKQILEQLLMLELGGMDSKDVSIEIQKLEQLASTLPPAQAKKLENLLQQMPSDPESKDYFGQLKGFFGKISGFVANLMGLSPNDQKQLQDILNKIPVDNGGQDYNENMEIWSAQLSSFLGSHVLGVSSAALQKIMSEEPTDTGSDKYPEELLQFMATLQVYMAENVPDHVSSSDKAKLDSLKKQIKNVDLNSPIVGALLSKYEAEIGVVIHSAFFSS